MKSLPTRLIPMLLIENESIVKGSKFKNHTYVGDPLNIIKLFNDLEANEIFICGITNTVKNKRPAFSYLQKIASQAFMPISYGGGISCVEDAEKIISIGFEKVALNSAAIEDFHLLKNISSSIGSSSTIASLDVKKNFFSRQLVFTHSGTKNTKMNPLEIALRMQDNGAGELILCSVDNEGTNKGFDYDLISLITSALDIPVIASGGAHSLDCFSKAVDAGADAAAAGNYFIFNGEHRAVLVSYPNFYDLLQM